jgi:signal transduction histidine kinase
MARHGGSVRLRSRAGEGTEVHLRMPTAVAAVEEKEHAE